VSAVNWLGVVVLLCGALLELLGWFGPVVGFHQPAGLSPWVERGLGFALWMLGALMIYRKS